MTSQIPTPGQVKAALSGLSMKQLASLYELSGVPVPTLYKIQTGVTTDPGIKTVAKFWPHLASMDAPRIRKPRKQAA